MGRSYGGSARHTDAGTSVVEFSVAMLVGALVLGAVAAAFVGALRVIHGVNASTATTADARHAGEAVSRTLRVAYPPAADQPAVVAASPSSVTFWALLDHSGAPSTTLPTPTLVRYSYDGQCLNETRTVSGTSPTTLCVVRTTRAPAFTYYPLGGVQADGSTPDPIPATPAVASQDLGRIQGVQIALTVQDPADPSAHPVSVVNQVTLENVVAAAAAAARGGSA